MRAFSSLFGTEEFDAGCYHVAAFHSPCLVPSDLAVMILLWSFWVKLVIPWRAFWLPVWHALRFWRNCDFEHVAVDSEQRERHSQFLALKRVLNVCSVASWQYVCSIYLVLDQNVSIWPVTELTGKPWECFLAFQHSLWMLKWLFGVLNDLA